MAHRNVLLVGSLPFDNEQEAMQIALDVLGDNLVSCPDGEIGVKTPENPRGLRSDWAATAMRNIAANPAFEVVKGAEFINRSTLESENPYAQRGRLQLRAKVPPGEMAAHLNFGYLDYFRESYPIFKKLREQANKPGIKFQVGVPTGFVITMGPLGPLAGLRYRKAFEERLATEVNQIVREAGDDVIIQIEVPIEMKMATLLPRFLWGIPLAMITGLVKRLDPAAQIGVHLCLGDSGHRALTHLAMTGLLVPFSNRLVAAWPRTHKLVYMHYPFAEANVAPPTDPAIYAPLNQIKLPEGVRFIAGFIHEKLDDDGHRKVLKAIEQAVGHPVEIACSCGMGRRPREEAERLLGVTKAVAAI